MISMNYSSSTSCWKPWRWVRFDLILTMRDIHNNSNLNPLTKYTSSSRSAKFKDILPWNISQMITKTISISTRIVISYAMNQGISFCVYWKVKGNWDNNMIRISQWRIFPNLSCYPIMLQPFAAHEAFFKTFFCMKTFF